MDRLLFAVDRFEEKVVILENIKTKEKKEVNRELLPDNIKEGSIVKLINNNFILDNDEEQKRRQEILERFKNLRKSDKLND